MKPKNKYYNHAHISERDFRNLLKEFARDSTAKELLNSSVARSIIKMTKDKDKQPVVLLEPTYMIVYKGDASMDRFFNLFADLMVAEPGKMKMARGNGNEAVSKGSSRSPEGQYEDLDLSHVKFIHKLSKPTKKDKDIMERIRSSR